MQLDDKPLIEFDRPAVIDRRNEILSRKDVELARQVLHRYDELTFDVLVKPDGFQGHEVVWRKTFGHEKANGVTRHLAKECWRKHCFFRTVSRGERNSAFAEFEDRLQELELRLILNHVNHRLTW